MNPSIPKDLLGTYQQYLQATQGLSPSTLRNYLADLAPFSEYLEYQHLNISKEKTSVGTFLSRNGLSNIAKEYRYLIRDYVSWLLQDRILKSGHRKGKKGMKRESVLRTLASLRVFWRYVISLNLAPNSPIWVARSNIMRQFLPRPTRKLPATLTVKNIEDLISSGKPTNGMKSTATRDIAISELLYGSGLRVSEATALNLRDVSFEHSALRVTGKGNKDRQIPFGRTAKTALEAYLELRAVSLTHKTLETPLFLNRTGNRLSVRSVQRLIKQRAQTAGLSWDVHPHTLRHSFATHLLDGGADLRIVQQLLGHTSPEATQVYTHISQQEARKIYLSAHPMAKREN